MLSPIAWVRAVIASDRKKLDEIKGLREQIHVLQTTLGNEVALFDKAKKLKLESLATRRLLAEMIWRCEFAIEEAIIESKDSILFEMEGGVSDGVLYDFRNHFNQYTFKITRDYSTVVRVIINPQEDEK